MNKKYLNSILTLLFVIIWGAVIYKYFGGRKRPSKNIEITSTLLFNKQDYLVTKDTFLLKLTDRDPFKISINKKRKAIKPPADKLKKAIKPIVKKKMVWPTITYHGFVKGESKTTRLIILKIDNRLYRKREKENINGIVLVKAYDDSLMVYLNNNSKTIVKTR